METALDIYELLGGVLVAAVSWGLKALSSYMAAKTKNERVSGILGRLSESVDSAVKMAHQTITKQIKAKKDPASPGGTKITPAEAEEIKKAVRDQVIKDFGGMELLRKAMSVLGIGDGLMDFIDSRIEARVHDTKAAKDPK